MRMMMRVAIPCEAGNKAVKDGSIGRILGQWSEENRPEAAYFVSDQGTRTAYFFLDVKDSTQIPALAEPFFLGLNAQVDFSPAMNPQDLKTGLEKVKV
jgi:hypothetical protein